MDVVIILTILLVMGLKTSLEARNDPEEGRLEGPPRTSDEDDEDYEYDEEDVQNFTTPPLTPEIRKRKQSARPPGFGPPKEHKPSDEQRSKRQAEGEGQSQLLKYSKEAQTESAVEKVMDSVSKKESVETW